MKASYFLGANTPYGFYSLFDELYDPYDNWNMYIIKGGPGTGKSTLMKEIATRAANRNLNVDTIPCSSDPMSLDGVIIPEIKTAICDGTSPHIVEPIFPGVCEHLVNLSECWDKNKLQENSSKIKIIAMTNSKAHKNCIRYLKTAKMLEDEINELIYPAINFEKIKRYVERMTEISNNEQAGEIKKKIRFLSAVTPSGLTINYNTFVNDCEKIITIKDNYNITRYILDLIEKSYNKNMIKYMCPLNPKSKTEHIVFTDIKFGIFTSNKYHAIPEKTYKVISTDRFINKDEFNKHKSSIAFLNKSKNEMIEEAIASLKTAKAAHDILESYYIDAMDFNKVNQIKEKVIKDIFE